MNAGDERIFGPLVYLKNAGKRNDSGIEFVASFVLFFFREYLSTYTSFNNNSGYDSSIFPTFSRSEGYGIATSSFFLPLTFFYLFTRVPVHRGKQTLKKITVENTGLP
jgi:hypothetical protein